MSNAQKMIVFNPIGWIIGSIIGAIIVSYIYSFNPPLKVVAETNDSNIAYAGEPYEICRKVKYIRDSTITLDRVITKNLITGDELNINVPSITITRKAGDYSICRNVVMPSYMESGNWVISTYITHNFWWWYHIDKLKDIPIQVLRK